VSFRRFVARHGSELLFSSRLDRIIDLVNRPLGGCIICYHHITSTTLEQQLNTLSRRYAIVPLSEMVSRHVEGRTTAGLMAITFDDGFAQEVESGCALALKHSWPMTFYLSTGLVSSGQSYWFEEVGPLLQAAQPGRYEVNGLSFELGDDLSPWPVRDRLVHHLFHRSSAEILSIMEQLRKTLFGSPDHLPSVRVPGPISWERVKELGQHDEIAFEAHSVMHPFFSTLSPGEIRREMETSRRELEEMTGQSVRHFCYPYGSIRSIGPTAPEIARSLFQSAATIVRGRCRPDVDRAMLLRIPLFEHYTAAMAAVKVETTR
jgi:peptidoglycan/xylan/chitin deacetylase (PgdA/CDA1 family)